MQTTLESPETKIYTPEQIQKMADQFLTTGYLIIPSVIPTDRCAEIRNEIDRIFQEIPSNLSEQGYGENLRTKLFHYSPLIADHMEYSPIIDIAEAILGKNCHLIANNAVRNGRSYAISFWHIDDESLFTMPDDMELDERIQISCAIFNAQWYVTDVLTPEDGPTQVVPYSHRSGRKPPVMEGDAFPRYKDHEAKSILVKAGDVCLQHAHVWHRGAPITTDNTRYVMQFAYGRRSFAPRFFPFNGYKTPDHVVDKATPRQKRLLGFHERGAYG